MTFDSQKTIGKDKISSQVASYGSERATDATEAVSAARLQEYRALLGQLRQALSGTLTNAQVMQWKLDPYSRIRRYVREIERNAQRGAEVLKQLEERLGIKDDEDEEEASLAENTLGNSLSADAVLAVARQEPHGRARTPVVVPLPASALAAPGTFLCTKAAHTKV